MDSGRDAYFINVCSTTVCMSNGIGVAADGRVASGQGEAAERGRERLRAVIDCGVEGGADVIDGRGADFWVGGAEVGGTVCTRGCV